MTKNGIPATQWPEGATSAAVLTFDFDAEEVWIADDPEHARLPSVLSQGTYGASTGLPLILDVLAETAAPATFFVPGRVAERHPDEVRSIAAAGHEVAHHGYTHTPPRRLTAAEQREEIVRGSAALADLGITVRGYRAPSCETTEDTLGLLQEGGFSYASNMMDRVHPYLHETGLVELPWSWILDDAAYFWIDGGISWTKQIATNDHVESVWKDEFDGIHALGGLFVLTMHPQVIGRPGRLRLLRAMIARFQQTRGCWLASAEQVAAWVTR